MCDILSDIVYANFDLYHASNKLFTIFIKYIMSIVTYAPI